MSNEELEKLREQLKCVLEHVYYDEGVVIGNIVVQLFDEIDRLNKN